ncbi:hypothetical protein JQ615_30430 [Bradyrhizobium jicamae]|uniref:Uncharacterized protein n=1 Tax=Bradyrhizobium jicamae TaxID=280332 RepID=A0ABS5FSB2_9BRAD|nr:hypothetical protein [Bradyrhizobium jicamae]MBR0799697.1 hypothetical protein [Bradyrhizobium jicamae]
MSEQQSEPVSAETGAETAAKPEQVAAVSQIEAPRLSPDQEATSPEADAKPDAPRMETSKIEPVKVDQPDMGVPEVGTGQRDEPRFPGKLMIMAPAERAWDHEEIAAKPTAEQPVKSSGGPRFAAMAAIVALATVAGAVGGALATAGLGHFTTSAVASAKDTKDTTRDAVQTSIARIDGEIQTLKSSIDQTARTGATQLNKTNDRLDKVEKAQAEPMAKLTKLSEAVDKLRAAPPVTAAAAPTQVAARETTGTVTSPATAAAAPKVEVGRLPVVEGWALRDVGHGAALIEGRQGMYEVYAGDPVPGLGRIDAIRKQDGRWVVVTSKGLIVAR